MIDSTREQDRRPTRRAGAAEAGGRDPVGPVRPATPPGRALARPLIRPLAGVFAWALVWALAPAEAGAGWPHWRGPHHDGTADAEGVFGAGAPGLEVAWPRPLGVGFSGVVEADGRLVTMHSDRAYGDVVALDVASGETLWPP